MTRTGIKPLFASFRQLILQAGHTPSCKLPKSITYCCWETATFIMNKGFDIFWSISHLWQARPSIGTDGDGLDGKDCGVGLVNWLLAQVLWRWLSTADRNSCVPPAFVCRSGENYVYSLYGSFVCDRCKYTSVQTKIQTITN